MSVPGPSGGDAASGRHTPDHGTPGRSDASNGTSNDPKRRRVSKLIKTVGGSALFVAALSALFASPLQSLGGHIASGITGIFGNPQTGPPVVVDLVSEFPADGLNEVFPDPLSHAQLTTLDSLISNSQAEYPNWLESHGAAAVNGGNIELIVHGNRENTARIIDMQPVETCRSPMTEALYYLPPGGDDPSTRLAINLDKPLSAPGYYAGYANYRTDYFSHYTVSLRHGEQFTFQITATTAMHYCQFTLNMTVLDGNRTLTETVSDNGQPFRVTASAILQTGTYTESFARYKYVYFRGISVNPASFKGALSSRLWTGGTAWGGSSGPGPCR